MNRAKKAGQDLARAIIEMADMMYMDNDAEDFYKGLDKEIQKEKFLRMIKDD